MSNTTVEYKRRNSNGFKNTRVRADTWVAHVNDFAPDDRSDGFATVDIHADMLHSDPAEITTRYFNNSSPFVAVDIGGDVGVTLYLSPQQARTLAVSLAESTPDWLGSPTLPPTGGTVD